MPNTHRPDPLNIRTKIISAVVLLWCIFLRTRRRCANAKHVRPLLKRLIVVFRR